MRKLVTALAGQTPQVRRREILLLHLLFVSFSFRSILLPLSRKVRTSAPVFEAWMEYVLPMKVRLLWSTSVDLVAIRIPLVKRTRLLNLCSGT